MLQLEPQDREQLMEWQNQEDKRPLVDKMTRQEIVRKVHKEEALWVFHLWMDLHCTLSSFGGAGRGEGLPEWWLDQWRWRMKKEGLEWVLGEEEDAEVAVKQVEMTADEEEEVAG